MLTPIMKLDVTQADIDEARCLQRAESYAVCTQCMVAVSLIRTTGLEFSVGKKYANFNIHDAKVTYSLHEYVSQMIAKFDHGQDVNPFSSYGELCYITTRATKRDKFDELILKLFPDAKITDNHVLIGNWVLGISNATGNYTCSKRQFG